MALTANRHVDHYIDQQLRTFPVQAAGHVFKGALVGLDLDGFVRGLQPGDRCCGIAYEEIDNREGAAGDRSVRVYTHGDFALPVMGVGAANRLAPLYAVDDESPSLAAGAPASYVGRVVDVLGTNLALVRLGPLGELPRQDHVGHLELFDDFLGASLDVADGRWRTVQVGDATAAIAAAESGGAFSLVLAATSEAEDAVLYHGDVKQFEVDHRLVFECRAKLAALGSGVTAVFGLAGDHDLDKDSIAQHAWFRLEDGLNLQVETDDGSSVHDHVDTQMTLVGGMYHTFRIDLSDLTDVRFFVDGIRVVTSTQFDLTGFAGGLQPYCSLDKSGGAGTGALTVDWIRITGTRT